MQKMLQDVQAKHASRILHGAFRERKSKDGFVSGRGSGARCLEKCLSCAVVSG